VSDTAQVELKSECKPLPCSAAPSAAPDEDPDDKTGGGSACLGAGSYTLSLLSST